MSSIWETVSDRNIYNKLEKDIKTDVLIIGGGMAGILCAYKLHDAGVSYILVEANTIGDGITKNSTAKITSQHGLIYDKIIKKYGIEKAKQYLEINQIALKEYSDLCKNINCDFEEKNSYVYSIYIQEWLGHSDYKTTANIYAHLDLSSKFSSLETLDSIIEI